MNKAYDFEDLKLKGFNTDEGIGFTGNAEKYAAALQRFLRRAGKKYTEALVKIKRVVSQIED